MSYSLIKFKKRLDSKVKLSVYMTFKKRLDSKVKLSVYMTFCKAVEIKACMGHVMLGLG